ncbi:MULTISPECIES: hypothetical protein [Micrococcaceae]|uniref:Pilus assembly protein n=2 Tax=Pseudoglutamicibacter albus TaxID=98671 RepID=A0A095YBZ6_9MICC|nr:MULTISPECIES: hypothetical protein [Micrococcaceae]KGF19616.1 hypothetical protein HMPREF2128_09485 [Pseudoglutamicibacter albus DNF00011]MCG7304785.1 hypothetical protein [Pseudoglutamicibacter albus]MDR7293308.1 hypothetical protein [Pseudoglutamicibacter albus]
MNNKFARSRVGSAVTAALVKFSALIAGAAPDEDRERGDVPGWVLVTLMSALLVAAIYAVAGPALIKLFNDAIGKVGGM